MKTLLQIITEQFTAAGHRGPLTKAFVDRWRADHPEYGRWPLSTLFRSGSPVPVRGASRLDRAQAACTTAGNAGPVPAEVLDAYEDEYTRLEGE